MTGEAASQERPCSFVVRLWLEPDPGGPKWRGHVRHVQGEKEVYFSDLAALLEFLGRCSGVPASVHAGG